MRWGIVAAVAAIAVRGVHDDAVAGHTEPAAHGKVAKIADGRATFEFGPEQRRHPS